MEAEEIPYPMAQPIMAGGLSSEGALQYQFENPKIVEEALHVFRGEVKVINPQTNAATWQRRYPAMVNEKGLAMIRGYLLMFLQGTKNYGLTDVSDEYIGESVIDVGRIIRDELYDHWEEYQVRGYSAASFIVERVTDLAYTIKKKGEDATYLKFLTKTHNISEVQHHQSIGAPKQDKGDGVLGMLFGKKKRGF